MTVITAKWEEIGVVCFWRHYQHTIRVADGSSGANGSFCSVMFKGAVSLVAKLVAFQVTKALSCSILSLVCLSNESLPEVVTIAVIV